MKRILLLLALVLGGAAVLRRLVPAERRAQLGEQLSQMPGRMMVRMMDHMPDD